MANELGTILEKRLRDKGWSVARLTLESGVSAEVIAGLLVPEELSSMPDESTLSRLSKSVDVSYRELVVAAGVACGLPKDQEDEPIFVLRFVTDQELLTELRRRLVSGRNDAESQRQRLTHLALVEQALAGEASRPSPSVHPNPPARYIQG